MASLALSIMGTAIAGPIGGAIGAAVGGLIDSKLFPGPKVPMPTVTTSTYGNAIPLLYGPYNRVGTNMIWSSPIRKVQNKSLKFLLGKGKGQPFTYEVDVAMAVGAGPLQPSWCQTIWANGTVIFDASAGTIPPDPDENGVVTWDVSFETFQDFDFIVVYPGNQTQLPDPTIESYIGVGNVPAYRGTAYILIHGLKLTTFGNGVPTMNCLVQAQATRPSVGAVVTDMVRRSGLPINLASTSALGDSLQGMQITSQMDAQTAIKDLALVFNFDAGEVAGQLRCQPRGLPAYAAISDDLFGAYVYGGSPPEPWEWPRAPEIQLPKAASLTFFDPARFGNVNTQASKRSTGNATSNINYTTQLTLTSDQARKTADRMLWEAQIGRQTMITTVDDRAVCLEPAKTFAFPTPAGLETVRITKVARGANGVRELEASLEYSSLYFSSAPAAEADAQRNVLVITGPVNPPIFLEPPPGFPGVTGPTVLIAISGGEELIVNDAWNGCAVYASTDEEHWILAGTQVGATLMGFLIGRLDNNGGHPDTIDILDVSTEECGLEPASMSAYDAGIALMPYWVGGEWLSAQTVQGLGGMTYRLTNLYRGLFGSHNDVHATGQPFFLADDRLFRFPLPLEFVGHELHFRFVGGGESIATVVDYTYTPPGSSWGPGTAGVPEQPDLVGTTPAGSGILINWNPASSLSTVSSVEIFRAPGSDASFSEATLLTTVSPQQTSYTDGTAVPGQSYTYFVVFVNAAGPSIASESSGSTAMQIIPNTSITKAATATEVLFAGALVTFVTGGVVLASAADATKPAQGFVLDDYAEGDTATVYLPGGIDAMAVGCDGPGEYYLSLTPGEVTSFAPSGIGALQQEVGFGTPDAQLVFTPRSATVMWS
jgi:hypothetical protein